MQKVVGSSPIIRFGEPRYGGVFVFRAEGCTQPRSPEVSGASR